MTASAGLTLKPQHFEEAYASPADGLWFEVHPENYTVAGGPRLAWLRGVRERHPISLHGVSLSLAADVSVDGAHLRNLVALADHIEPAIVSEHLAWSTWRGVYHPDLLPFPRTAAALDRVADNIDRAQSALRRRIAIENPAHYLQLEAHDYEEVDFLSELVRRTGCGLLLDVNNVYVSACNLGFSAARYIDAFPGEDVLEIHLAGHTKDPTLGEGLLVDSHDSAISPEVWVLYERLIGRIGPRPTLIERDGNIPGFEELLAERAHAQCILGAALEAVA
jgi:hypothetical protein